MNARRVPALVAIAVVLGCLSAYNLSGGPPGPAGAKTKRVTVLCGDGGSINRALQTEAETLYIEIQGMCQEKVVVQRDNVFLLGSDATAPNGIVAPDLPAPEEIEDLQGAYEARLLDAVALLIKGSRWVYVGPGLTIELGSASRGGHGAVRVADSHVAFEGCTINNSRGWGMVVEDSYLRGKDLEFEGCDDPEQATDCLGGLLVTDGSDLDMGGATFTYGEGIDVEGKSRWDLPKGILVGDDDKAKDLSGRAYANFGNITVKAPLPVRATGSMHLCLSGSKLIPIPADGRTALDIVAGSSAWVFNTTLHGGFGLWDRAFAWFEQVTQIEEGVYEGVANQNGINEASVFFAYDCVFSGRLNLGNSSADLGNVVVKGTPVNGDVWAMGLGNGASAYAWGSQFEGGMRVAEKSRLKLDNSVQTSGVNRVVEDSYVTLFNASQIEETMFHGFSHGQFSSDSRINGNLNCVVGSDAYCEDPTASFTDNPVGTSNCGLCLYPVPSP